MPFTAIYGLPGRGKSLLMLQHGLRIADKYHLKIVTNFSLDPIELAYYCKITGLNWLWKNIPKGIVYYVSANKNFAQFLQIKDAVILLDEMGLYAPSCQSWTLPPEAHNAVANNRKRCQHIVYAAQYPSQVHSSIHQICSEVLYAEGIAVWDDKLKNDRLLFKDVHLFMPSEFEVWFRDPKVRKNPVKVWVLATKHWKGVISAFDAQTFKVYDSFGLLEEQDQAFAIQEGSFVYRPYVVDGSTSDEIGLDELLSRGRSFSEVEAVLTEHYKNDRFRKKRVAEASQSQIFIAWKLSGEIPLKPPHPFQKQMRFFWDWLPAATYPGLKRLDDRITNEFLTWSSMSSANKRDYKNFFRGFLGTIIFLLALLVTNIFVWRHPFVFFLSCFGSFFLPFRWIK